jgi:hypothetical protein
MLDRKLRADVYQANATALPAHAHAPADRPQRASALDWSIPKTPFHSLDGGTKNAGRGGGSSSGDLQKVGSIDTTKGKDRELSRRKG